MSGEGARGVIIFFSLFYVSSNFKRIFFSKNRRTLFGPLKCRQTLFNEQFLLYKYFCDFFAIYTAIVHRKCFSTICNTNLQSKFASNISNVPKIFILTFGKNSGFLLQDFMRPLCVIIQYRNSLLSSQTMNERRNKIRSPSVYILT